MNKAKAIMSNKPAFLVLGVFIEFYYFIFFKQKAGREFGGSSCYVFLFLGGKSGISSVLDGSGHFGVGSLCVCSVNLDSSAAG